jgi:hypothetical protein
VKALLPAVFAVAADFGARHGDFDAAVLLDLLLQFFVEFRFKLAHFSAFQAGDVDMVAQAVAFVEVLVAAQMQQIKLIDQAITLEQIESSIHCHAMHAGIDFLGAIENRSGVEMTFGVVHHLKQHFSLAREANTALFERSLKTARALVSVDSFSGGNSMCGGWHIRAEIRLLDLRIYSPRINTI